MNLVEFVSQNQLPDTILDNVDHIGSGNVTYIKSSQQWLRRFDMFEHLRDEYGVRLSPFEVVNTLESHLGFIASSDFLEIPNRTHFLVTPSSEENEAESSPALYTLVDNISESGRSWFNSAHRRLRQDVVNGIGSYISWVENNNEPYGLFDLARYDQFIYGSVTNQTHERSYLIDLCPYMTDLSFIDSDGYNQWDEQKDMLSNLAQYHLDRF